MDYFAHGLWSYIIFHKTKVPWYAVLFGLIADSTSWLVYLVYNLTFGGIRFGSPHLSVIPKWVFILYGISHSLFVCAGVMLIVYVFIKKVPIFMFAWPIAIVMDMLTHSREFLPTPFLWPFSNWYFPGISWGTPWFMITNYSLIVIGLVWIIVKKYRKSRKEKQISVTSND